MPQQNSATLAFNRGVLSTLGLARVDITRYRMAAQVMTNWMPRVLGSMMLRPGGGYIGATDGNSQARTIPFIFSADDTARIEITDNTARIWVDDELVTRVSVGTTVTNGTFASDLSGWTNSSEAGASVTWEAASDVSFVGTGSNDAILDQEVTVASADENSQHALRIIVTRGPITLRIGTSQGDDSLQNETALNTGTHSIAFTPGQTSFWIRFFAPSEYAAILASCVVESAGVLTLPLPWGTADLQSLRWAQSADVVFIGCNGYPQQQFERRATDSWSIVDYTQTVIDGPFRTINISNITLTASATSGDITLTASKSLFKSGHVGALFRLLSIGQLVNVSLAAEDTYSNAILVTGVGSQRGLAITISGTWVGKLHLQYSVGAPGQWVDLTNGGNQGPYTGNGTWTYTDGLDNQDIYYRIGIDPGDYTSGTAVAALSISSGSITGICRITAVASSTSASAQVLLQLGNTTATSNWYEGAWSTFRGFPGTPSLWQGRLWWFGTGIYGSVSDAYNSFDDTVTGASAPIIGQLDSGPIDNIYWAVGLQQLVIGTASAETSLRSTYLGDAISTTNFNVMTGSTQGGANVNAVQIDLAGIFVQISGQRVFSLNLDIYTYSYKSQELTLLVPDFNSAGIVQLAYQNKPDRRLHCVRADGTAGVMIWDPTENVQCWCEVVPANGGVIEDVSVLPGVNQAEDQVYYIVRRTVNGSTVRYHEKWALETECTGLPTSKTVDSHVVYSGDAATTLTAIAPHLVGQTVCVWGWNTDDPYTDGNGNQPGLDLGTYVVGSDGSISGLTLKSTGASYAVTNAIIGLGYTAQWKSMKQAFAAAMGTPLNQPKRIPRLGLILENTHAQGLLIGNDFEHLDDIPWDDLPRVSSGANAAVDLNAILNDYDQQMSAFNDIWSTDSRVCLQAASPRPCTVLAFTAGLDDSG